MSNLLHICRTSSLGEQRHIHPAFLTESGWSGWSIVGLLFCCVKLSLFDSSRIALRSSLSPQFVCLGRYLSMYNFTIGEHPCPIPLLRFPVNVSPLFLLGVYIMTSMLYFWQKWPSGARHHFHCGAVYGHFQEICILKLDVCNCQICSTQQHLKPDLRYITKKNRKSFWQISQSLFGKSLHFPLFKKLSEAVWTYRTPSWGMISNC